MNFNKLLLKYSRFIEQKQKLIHEDDILFDAFYAAIDNYVNTETNIVFNREDLDLFFSKYKNNIEQIKKWITSEPVELGSGQDGSVFDIGGDKVLKIFFSEFAYQKALTSMNLLFDNPYLAKTETAIYDADVVGFISNKYVKSQAIYYYIQEKMNAVDNSNFRFEIKYILLEIAYNLDAYKQNLNGFIEKIEQGKQIKNDIKLIAKHIARKLLSKDEVIVGYYHQIKEAYRLQTDWLELLIEEIIVKYITGRLDLHTGNLGFTNYGLLKYFDPAYEDWGVESDVNPSQQVNIKA